MFPTIAIFTFGRGWGLVAPAAFKAVGALTGRGGFDSFPFRFFVWCSDLFATNTVAIFGYYVEQHIRYDS